ncbi:hypothetical protein FKP32DRAFT_139518 [Trametes sanguinea]|nr:hypothetical protein FKP32DRAFT_139518 [Trametes sanguinea]
MDLDSIINPDDAGGIRTANTIDSRAMDAPPVSQMRRSTRPRPEQSTGTARHKQRTSPAKQQRKRPNDEHRVRGGAKYNNALHCVRLHNVSPARMDATSSRHRRNRKPPSSAGDRPLSAEETTRPPTSNAPEPSSSPAKDLLRRAQHSAATDVDSLGRRPFIMDLILGGRPVVSQYSEDVIMEAIELSRAALRPSAGPFSSADERSAMPREERPEEAGEFSTAASGKSPQLANAGYQVSAERTTAIWPRDKPPCLPEMSQPNRISSPSVRLDQLLLARNGNLVLLPLAVRCSALVCHASYT